MLDVVEFSGLVYSYAGSCLPQGSRACQSQSSCGASRRWHCSIPNQLPQGFRHSAPTSGSTSSVPRDGGSTTTTVRRWNRRSSSRSPIKIGQTTRSSASRLHGGFPVTCRSGIGTRTTPGRRGVLGRQESGLLNIQGLTLSPLLLRGMCIGSDSKGRYTHTDRHKALRLVTGTQTTNSLCTTWMTELPNSTLGSAPAYRMLRQFKDGGSFPKKAGVWELTDLGIAPHADQDELPDGASEDSA